jgi:uncharacterized protein YciI
MLFVLLGFDRDGSLETRLAARSGHLARLVQLQNEARLVVGGPMPRHAIASLPDAGFTGTLLVAEFPTIDAARSWLADDPYVKAGVFARTEVYPFVQARF